MLLIHAVLWAFWALRCYCMRVPLYPGRSGEFSDKYEWPEAVLKHVTMSRSIPDERYTDKQAKDFVALGLLYLERNMSPGQLFNALGSNGKQISRSFVHGTDESLGPLTKIRWRWMPLIESFDASNQPVYHTSMWSDGSTLRSVDIVRLDFFQWRGMRWFLPTAIVRPQQKHKGFGRALQFITVYEFPSSFSTYLRNPTPTAASSLVEAVHKDSSHWFRLLRPENAELMNINYQVLTEKWIQENLRAALPKISLHTKAGKIDQGSTSTANSNFVPRHQVDGESLARLGLDSSITHWAAHSLVYPSSHYHDRSMSDAWTLPSPELPLLRQSASSSETESLNTELRLGPREPESRIYAPVPLRPTPFHPDDSSSRLELDRSGAIGSQEGGSRTTTSIPGVGRSGFSRWRRPFQAVADQSGPY